jgi:hypothetical protein
MARLFSKFNWTFSRLRRKPEEMRRSLPVAGTRKMGSPKGGFTGKTLVLLLALRSAIPALSAISRSPQIQLRGPHG